MFGRKKQQAELKSGDAKFLSEVRAAQVMDDMSRATWTLYLMAVAVIVAITWASTPAASFGTATASPATWRPSSSGSMRACSRMAEATSPKRWRRTRTSSTSSGVRKSR